MKVSLLVTVLHIYLNKKKKHIKFHINIIIRSASKIIIQEPFLIWTSTEVMVYFYFIWHVSALPTKEFDGLLAQMGFSPFDMN